MRRRHTSVILVLAIVAITFLIPEYCLGGFESSLVSIKMKITGVFLPLISVIGLAIAAMSFYTGNPNAKQHLVYAILGCIFGFGAQGIVDLIAQTVR